MSLETGILDRLAADAGVSALVGTRLRHEFLDQDQPYPALRLIRISTATDYSLDMASPLSRVRLQVDCYADSFADVNSLANAVESSLVGFDYTVGTIVVRTMVLDNKILLGEKNGDQVIRRIALDFIAIHE